MPLHPNQHAYQAGKSLETVLKQLEVWVEKVLDQQETGCFLRYRGGHVITPLMTPYVLLLSNTGLITPLYGALTLPWMAA
jgi:hypothetical protein